MRQLLLCSLLLVAAVSHADRFITIPTGSKIPDGKFKLELQEQPKDHFYQAYLGYGLTSNFEFEVGQAWSKGTAQNTSLNLGYNIIRPITDILPGISMGLLDASNVTKGGRAAYVAITYDFGNDGELNQDTPTELTFGFWSRESNLLFVGFSFPFTNEVRMIAEHDGRKLTAGIDYRPSHDLSLRLLTEENHLLLSAGWTRKL